MRRRSTASPDLDYAKSACVESSVHLQDIENRGPEVREITKALRRLHQQNQFLENLLVVLDHMREETHQG